jgi:hypothetical protein
MTKLMVAFRNFANSPKKETVHHVEKGKKESTTAETGRGGEGEDMTGGQREEKLGKYKTDR